MSCSALSDRGGFSAAFIANNAANPRVIQVGFAFNTPRFCGKSGRFCVKSGRFCGKSGRFCGKSGRFCVKSGRFCGKSERACGESRRLCGKSRRVRWKYAQISRVLSRGSAFNKNGFAALFAIKAAEKPPLRRATLTKSTSV